MAADSASCRAICRTHSPTLSLAIAFISGSSVSTDASNHFIFFLEVSHLAAACVASWDRRASTSTAEMASLKARSMVARDPRTFSATHAQTNSSSHARGVSLLTHLLPLLSRSVENEEHR